MWKLDGVSQARKNVGERVWAVDVYTPDDQVVPFGALLLFSWVISSGRGGQRPPRVSMAMEISASGVWNPYARVVRVRRCVFVASERALDIPWTNVFLINGRNLVMVAASLTNSGIRQRRPRRSSRRAGPGRVALRGEHHPGTVP